MPIPTDHLKSTKLTAKESTYNQLQQWIIDGTLHPGEKLNDTEIAQALGVSRTPVRESLQLLEVDGFVKMYPGKATQVTEVDRDSISDLLPPLAVLQALAAELAIPQLNDELIHSLKETNKRFAEAVRAENYFSALKIDEEFHQLIVDASCNAYIEKLLSSLQAHVRRLFFHNSIILTEKSIREHDQVIQLIMDGKADEVTAVMKTNWLRAIDEFKSKQ